MLMIFLDSLVRMMMSGVLIAFAWLVWTGGS
jgi:hypothetical protein